MNTQLPLPVLFLNFKVHKNSCLLFLEASHKTVSTPGHPSWLKFRWSLPTQRALFFPPSMGFVWPKKASLLLKGDGVGTLEGLFLAACHYETFQLARRTKTTARKPSLLRLRPGSTSGTAQKVTGGQAGFVTHLCAPRPPVFQLEKYSPLQKAWGIESENVVIEGTSFLAVSFPHSHPPNHLPQTSVWHQKERTEVIPRLNNTSDSLLFFLTPGDI